MDLTAPPASGPSLIVLLTIGEIASLAAGAPVAAWAGGWRPALLVSVLTAMFLLVGPRPRWRFTLSVLDDLPLITCAVGGATLASVSGLALLDRSFQTTERALGAALAGVVLFAALALGRAVTYAVAHELRHRGVGTARAIIIGAGSTGMALGRMLEFDTRLGVTFLGYVDSPPGPQDGGGYLDGPPIPPDGRALLGNLESLPAIVHKHGVNLVLVAFPGSGCSRIVDPIRSIRPADCEVYVVPRLYELHDRAVVTDLVNGIPLVRLRRLAFRSPSWRVKRVLDVLIAGIAMLVTSPMMVALAIAVRFETGRGVIFKQVRVGRDGRMFMLYKFRSLKPAEGEDATRWSIDGDTRVGRVGNFIRSTSLDELPQLMNILRGDMSLVGPRPERPYFVDQFEQSIPGYRHRHRMPAGLTGLAAVHGLRGDTGIPARAHLDNIYAESWSLWLDVKIIIRTAAQQFSPRRLRRRARRQKAALG